VIDVRDDGEITNGSVHEFGETVKKSLIL